MSTSSLTEIGTDILKHLNLDVDFSLKFDNLKMLDDEEEEDFVSASCKTSIDNPVKLMDDNPYKENKQIENLFLSSEREKSYTASLPYVSNKNLLVSNSNDISSKLFYNTSRIYPQSSQHHCLYHKNENQYIYENPFNFHPGFGIPFNQQQNFQFILPSSKKDMYNSKVNYSQQNENLRKNIYFISNSIPEYPKQNLPFFDEVIKRINYDNGGLLKDYTGKIIFEKLILKLTSFQRIKLWDSLVDKFELLCSSFTLYESLNKLLKLAIEIPEQQKVVYNINESLDTLIKTEYGSNLIVYIILNYCPESVYRISSFILTHIKQLINKHEGIEILNSFVIANIHNETSLKIDFINALYPHLIYIINNGMSSSLILEVLKNWKISQMNKIFEFMRNNVIAIINGKHSSLIIKWMIENLDEKVR